MFSKACEYGIRAIIYVAMQSEENKRVSLKDISKEIDSPEAFTAKILQLLVKNNFITSLKGPTGGFVMTREKMDTVRLVDVVIAIDGENVFEGCGLGLKECSDENPCPLHNKFSEIKEELLMMLENTSIGELSAQMLKGTAFLKL